MSKNIETVIDDKEDLNITKVAYKKKSQKLLLFLLILIFFSVLSITVMYIKRFYNNLENIDNYQEVTKVRDNSGEILVANNGVIDAVINNTSFPNGLDDLVIENIDYMEYTPTEDKDYSINYNVRYRIYENEFQNNATNVGKLFVKFSYSYDKENWEYITNVISTESSNISPGIGRVYDITNETGVLKIATNEKLKGNKAKKIYWRSETIVRNSPNFIKDQKLKVNFRIEY